MRSDPFTFLPTSVVMLSVVTFKLEYFEFKSLMFWFTVTNVPSTVVFKLDTFWSISFLTSTNVPSTVVFKVDIFCSVSSLTSKNIPSTVTLKSENFWSISFLTLKNIPSTVTLKSENFCSVSFLTSKNIPSTVTLKSVSLVLNSSLTSTNIPSVVILKLTKSLSTDTKCWLLADISEMFPSIVATWFCIDTVTRSPFLMWTVLSAGVNKSEPSNWTYCSSL